MGGTSAKQHEIAYRRERVARLRLRQLSMREIVKALPAEGVFNPRTEEPYDLATVQRDLKAIHAEWKASYLGDYAQSKAEHVAELKEARRIAWLKDKLFYVSKLLEQEARVMGFEEHSGEDIAEKARQYLDLLDTVLADAKDMSE